jgi:hypothetical protein
MKKHTRKNGIDLTNGTTELQAHVQCKLGRQVRDLQVVIVDQGQGLVLRGRARSYYAKQLAQHAVLEVAPLPILANEIEVS